MADFAGGGVLGPELDEVGAAVAELPRHPPPAGALEIGRIDEGVE